MQTAIAYSRILRQLASRKADQERIRAEQRLQADGDRAARPAATGTARVQPQSVQH